MRGIQSDTEHVISLQDMRLSYQFGPWRNKFIYLQMNYIYALHKFSINILVTYHLQLQISVILIMHTNYPTISNSQHVKDITG